MAFHLSFSSHPSAETLLFPIHLFTYTSIARGVARWAIVRRDAMVNGTFPNNANCKIRSLDVDGRSANSRPRRVRGPYIYIYTGVRDLFHGINTNP